MRQLYFYYLQNEIETAWGEFSGKKDNEKNDTSSVWQVQFEKW